MKLAEKLGKRPRKWTAAFEEFNDGEDWCDKTKLWVLLGFLDHKIPIDRPLKEAGLLALFRRHLSLMTYVPEDKRGTD